MNGGSKRLYPNAVLPGEWRLQYLKDANQLRFCGIPKGFKDWGKTSRIGMRGTYQRMKGLGVSLSSTNIMKCNQLSDKHRQFNETTRDCKEKILAQKLSARAAGEATHPFFTGRDSNGNAMASSHTAVRFACAFREVWYDTDSKGFVVLAIAKLLLAFAFPINKLLSLAGILKRMLTGSPKEKETLENLKNDSKEHFTKTSVFDADGFIINQNAMPEIAYAFGSTAKNGCGWISVYNVLKMLNGEDAPYKIMRDVEFHSLAGGKLGTNPFGMQKHLKKQGYQAKICYTKDDIEREAPNAKACIWVNGYYIKGGGIGAHYAAFKPNGENRYNIYNGFKSETDSSKAYPIEYLYNNVDIFRFMICVS